MSGVANIGNLESCVDCEYSLSCDKCADLLSSDSPLGVARMADERGWVTDIGDYEVLCGECAKAATDRGKQQEER